jgi:hypothetical protein
MKSKGKAKSKVVLLSDTAFSASVKKACGNREEGAVMVQSLLVDARLHFMQTGTVARVNELHGALSARDACTVRNYLTGYASDVLSYSRKSNTISVKEDARRTQFAVLAGRWDDVRNNVEKDLADLMKLAKRLYTKAAAADEEKVKSVADAKKIAKHLAPLFAVE